MNSMATSKLSSPKYEMRPVASKVVIFASSMASEKLLINTTDGDEVIFTSGKIKLYLIVLYSTFQKSKLYPYL